MSDPNPYAVSEVAEVAEQEIGMADLSQSQLNALAEHHVFIVRSLAVHLIGLGGLVCLNVFGANPPDWLVQTLLPMTLLGYLISLVGTLLMANLASRSGWKTMILLITLAAPVVGWFIIAGVRSHGATLLKRHGFRIAWHGRARMVDGANEPQ